MIKIKDNKGITLITLIITIVVLLIITGITITLSMDSVDQTLDSQDKSEMLIIQHAIQERYVEYMQTKDADLLIGTKIPGYDFRYEISEKEELKVPAGKTYFIAANNNEETTIYYLDNGNKIEIEIYRNAIFEISDLPEIEEAWGIYTKKYEVTETNAQNVKINCFKLLGVTGQGVSNSEFIVDYETGYVEKEGASTSLNGYNKNASGETTSFEVNISN